MTQGRLQMQLAPYEMILLSTFTTSILNSYHHKKKKKRGGIPSNFSSKSVGVSWFVYFNDHI